MKIAAIGLALAAASCAGAASAAPAYHLIPGQVTPGKGPDGNSIFLETPRGLILVDTGRHPEHRDKLLAYAAQRKRPIIAIINTHWHFDHTTGNREILNAFPRADVIASRAIDGPLYKAFAAKNRKDTEAFVASGQASPAQLAEIRRGFAAMDDPAALRAKRPVDRSGRRVVGGRALQVNLAPYAATEGDVWVYDPKARLVIAGDLVVGLVPFMDTACPEGWARALDAIAKLPFQTLIPGHGDPMTRADFLTWKTAYNHFVECGRSTAPKEQCIVGWQRDAARFIDEARREYVRQAADYYLTTRLRSSAAEQRKYCRPRGNG